LWLDEAFSIWMARQPLGDLLGWIVRIDQHPPLYYVLLHGWLALSDSEGWVRSLSAIFSTTTIPLFYGFVRTLAGGRAGLIAALLLAVAPFHVRFAQEARMYALLTFAVAGALLCLAWLMTGEGRGARGEGRPRWRQRLAWIGYVLFTVAALLTHNTALFLPVAINLYVLGLMGWRRGSGDGQRQLETPRLRSWLAAQLAVVVLWLPWSVAFVRQSIGVYAQFWITAPTAQTVLDTLLVFATGGFSNAWIMPGWVWLIFGALFVLGVAALRTQPALLALLLTLWLTPFVGEWLVSLRRPIFYDRTLIWASLPLYTILAIGVVALRRKLVIAVVLGGLVIAQLLSLHSYYRDFRKEEWREAAAYAAQHFQPGDLLLFNATWVQIPFDYYFDRAGIAAERHGAPADLFAAGVLEPIMGVAYVPRLNTLLDDRARVWLIYSHDWYTDPQQLIPATLQSEFTLLDRQPVEGLELRLYAR
ncbi:MAG TPA: glycosyltransferase family 39 protein, partial [Caldilinea sp.]|nr:glycosyltransferase family 39 protein [Caldilinea sp.]